MIGRLTRDPQITYTAQSQTAVARFTLAIDRGKDRDGNDKGADFPSCVAFGKTAELIDKYVHKGDRLGLMGRVQTGSYEKDGQKIYTTDIVADRIEFLTDRKNTAGADDVPAPQAEPYDGFAKLSDDDIPFE